MDKVELKPYLIKNPADLDMKLVYVEFCSPPEALPMLKDILKRDPNHPKAKMRLAQAEKYITGQQSKITLSASPSVPEPVAPEPEIIDLQPVSRQVPAMSDRTDIPEKISETVSAAPSELPDMDLDSFLDDSPPPSKKDYLPEDDDDLFDLESVLTVKADGKKKASLPEQPMLLQQIQTEVAKSWQNLRRENLKPRDYLLNPLVIACAIVMICSCTFIFVVSPKNPLQIWAGQYWEGIAEQPDYRTYPAVICIQTVADKQFTGYMMWESLGATVSMNGYIVDDLSILDQDSRWRFFDNDQDNRAGVWLRMVSTRIIQGGGVYIGDYYAHIDTKGNLHTAFFKDVFVSSPGSQYYLTVNLGKTC